jgi:predicted alpha/beta hydrolase family esterase
MTEILLVPGLWNSGPEHWQSHWERERRDCRRVVQREWATPACSDWMEGLETAVAAARGAVVLAAHSLGCCLVAHWGPASRHARKVRGALLVAPSDVEAEGYPVGPTGFAPMPLEKLPFPSVVVASTDDRYVTAQRAAVFARAWKGRLVEVGAKGHINGDSRLGRWPEGLALLEQMLQA